MVIKIKNNKFFGGERGISAPAASNLDVDGNEFHKTKLPVEIRDTSPISSTKAVREFLDKIFNVPNLSEQKTVFFKGKSHDNLLEIFNVWFRLASQLNGLRAHSLNIQGLHDRGIDLIIELSGKINARVGVQIKCDNDLDGNLSRQVDNTLANYDTYHIDYVIFIFCGDYTNQSHKTKIRQEIARIEQKDSIDKLLLIEAPKALILLKDLMPMSSYLEQFRAIPDDKKFSMRIVDFEENDSGFPVVCIESKSFLNGDESISLAKAYLSTILGFVSPDMLELGFFENGHLVIGTCPIEKAIKSIRVNDRTLIKIPMWFIRGLEEHGFLTFWGSSAHPGGPILKLFLQFWMTKADFEKDKHYQFVKNKFSVIANRMKQLGEIAIEH